MTKVIGIDASRAFVESRTGIEEYSYQVIKHLIREMKNDQVVLYVRKGQNADFDLPSQWKLKVIHFPFFWTQLGLSLELLLRPVDVLFVPAHVVPLFHPQNTIVTVHGLEYEIFPKGYSFWERLYMRSSIKLSCYWAKKIIAVSENTKKDLVQIYKIVPDKIEVIYEGIGKEITNHESQITNRSEALSDNHYLLFIGRLEARKNIIGIIKTFEILKEKYNLPHKLVLAGKSGYSYGDIKAQISNSEFKNDILEAGFVSEDEKWKLLSGAEVFLFPTFYEGFGLPILEAQSVGIPVVASRNSSALEMFSESALLVDPNNPQQIAEAVHKLVSDEKQRSDIIRAGYENSGRFSWFKCAGQIAKVLNS